MMLKNVSYKDVTSSNAVLYCICHFRVEDLFLILYIFLCQLIFIMDTVWLFINASHFLHAMIFTLTQLRVYSSWTKCQLFQACELAFELRINSWLDNVNEIKVEIGSSWLKSRLCLFRVSLRLKPHLDYFMTVWLQACTWLKARIKALTFKIWIWTLLLNV